MTNTPTNTPETLHPLNTEVGISNPINVMQLANEAADACRLEPGNLVASADVKLAARESRALSGAARDACCDTPALGQARQELVHFDLPDPNRGYNV